MKIGQKLKRKLQVIIKSNLSDGNVLSDQK